MFETGEITSVEELAHIVGQKGDGPRGNRPLPLDERDEYKNILVLCPNCHSIIDKNPRLFPDELLLGWKAHHEDETANCFGVRRYGKRADLNRAVSILLIANRVAFQTYGPFSENWVDPLAKAAVSWVRAVRTQIIPNNRKILQLCIANTHLMGPEEVAVIQSFRLHKEALEFNHLSGDKDAAAPLFPTEMAVYLGNQMPDRGYYEKIPRPESRALFMNYLKGSRVIEQVEEVSHQVIVVRRNGKSSIKIFLTNIYIVSISDVYEITAEHSDLHAIVTMSAWNGYTYDAKQECISRGVGLFKFKEFLGAVYYEGKRFFTYTPPERR